MGAGTETGVGVWTVWRVSRWMHQKTDMGETGKGIVMETIGTDDTRAGAGAESEDMAHPTARCVTHIDGDREVLHEWTA